MIKAVIFDYDGVLVHSFPTVHRAYQRICKELGVAYPTDFETFQKMYGAHYGELYTNLGIPEQDHPRAGKLFAQEIVKENPPLHPRVGEMLSELSKHYTLAIVSASTQEEITQKLRQHGIEKYFTRVQGTGDVETKKWQALGLTVEDLGLKKDEVVFVGDRDVDDMNRVKAGLPHFLIVEYGWGYTNTALREKQSQVIKEPMDIIEAISKIYSNKEEK